MVVEATDFRRFISYSFDGSGSSDRYNFAPVNYLLQPIERFNVYGQGTLRLTDRINANVQAVYVKRDSDQQLAEVPLTMDVRGINGPQWAFAPTAGSVFNPFGQNLRGANFRSIAVGPRKPYYDNDNLAVTMSLDGSFDLAGRDMYWDVGYSYLASRITTRGENYINLFNLRRAVGDSRRNPITGALECMNGTAVIAGCVPFNLFGGPDLGVAAGVITAAKRDAAIRYISYTKNEFQENTTKDYFANLSGSIVDLPAGPLGFALGLEHRRTGYVNQPDALVAGGGSSDNFSELTNGTVNSDEIYAELNVPILADIPGVKMLEVNLAARKSDYETAGFLRRRQVRLDLGGDTSKKIGVKWQVFDDLMFRGTYSESFRAPSVNDLQIRAAAKASRPRPIPATRPISVWRPPMRAAVSAHGVPAGGVAQANAQIRSLVGGNPSLQPEFGTTKSFGVVYSPSWAPGLNFTLDWFNIALEDVISFRGSQSILNACYRVPGSPGAAADPAQRALFCSFVTRDSAGNITDLRQTSFNLSQGEVEGYDFQATYAMPETAWGKFSFQWDNTYQTENTLFGTVGEYNGAPTWRRRSNITASWQKGDWDANWAVRYYSALDETCDGGYYFEYGITPSEICNHDVYDSNGNFLRYENEIGSRIYHDVQVGVKLPWNASSPPVPAICSAKSRRSPATRSRIRSTALTICRAVASSTCSTTRSSDRFRFSVNRFRKRPPKGGRFFVRHLSSHARFRRKSAEGAHSVGAVEPGVERDRDPLSRTSERRHVVAEPRWEEHQLPRLQGDHEIAVTVRPAQTRIGGIEERIHRHLRVRKHEAAIVRVVGVGLSVRHAKTPDQLAIGWL